MTTSRPYAPARLVVDLNAIAANWLTLQSLAGAAGCSAVVKADAYGLGAEHVAPALYAAGCRTFFVALVDEGIAVRAVLPLDAEVFVLHGPVPGSEQEFQRHQLTPVLNSLEQVKAYKAAAGNASWPLPVALQFDTGMSRMGMSRADVQVLTEKSEQLNGLNVVLVMSHLACADEPSSPFNDAQRELFLELKSAFPNAIASFANSSGIFLGEAFHFDLVRPGAALYGVNPAGGRSNPMKPVVTLAADIIQYRFVETGAGVGYNLTWRAERPSTLATISVGYADGYMRSLSGRASVSIGGVTAPVIGRVSMDSIIVDATGIGLEYLAYGCRATLLDASFGVDDLAAQASTIGYEVLTSLGTRYKREYLAHIELIDIKHMV